MAENGYLKSMGTLFKFLLGFIGILGFLYWWYLYAPATNTPFAPSSIPIVQDTTTDTTVVAQSSQEAYGAKRQETYVLGDQLVPLVLEQVRAGALYHKRQLGDTGIYQLANWHQTTVQQNHYLSIQLYLASELVVYLYEADSSQAWVGLVRQFIGTTSSEAQDSLMDLNADGHLDYWVYLPYALGVVENSHVVFIQDTAQQQLKIRYDLPNATFYPEEAVVRGLDYCGDDQFYLYTYRWVGTDLETVEHIEPVPCASAPDYLVRKVWRDSANWIVTDDTIIDSVPIENRNMDHAKWITY